MKPGVYVMLIEDLAHTTGTVGFTLVTLYKSAFFHISILSFSVFIVYLIKM